MIALIVGFDQIMPEPRGFPRFIPRPGARISINFGPSVTSRIKPLVDDWRGIAEKQGDVGIGGEWSEGEREVRSKGAVPGEEEVRIKITETLQQALAGLGQQVEEGRVGWRQSQKS